jgi:hypothetical protein
MGPDPNQFHKYPLNYGRTDGMNLSGMPENQYFCVGYNDDVGMGFVDVLEGHGSDGTPVYEGKVDISGLLAGLPERNDATAGRIDDAVEGAIMDDHNSLF